MIQTPESPCPDHATVATITRGDISVTIRKVRIDGGLHAVVTLSSKVLRTINFEYYLETAEEMNAAVSSWFEDLDPLVMSTLIHMAPPGPDAPF